MKEQFDPPDDLSLDNANQTRLQFEPVMTQEVLKLNPDVRRRAEVVADRAPKEDAKEVVPISDVEILPPVLAVESDTRKAHIRVRLLLAILTVVTLVQFITYLGLRNRTPIRIYAEAPSDTLVQPWR